MATRERDTAQQLEQAFEERVEDLPDLVSADSIDRILSGPMQETLLEAVAADAVDVVPVIGDLTALARKQQAEAAGMEYPERPAFVENAISDLPPPIDTIGDIIIAQNVMSYLEREQNIPVATAFEEQTESFTNLYQNAVDTLASSVRDN